jgi:hypothetical protein
MPYGDHSIAPFASLSFSELDGNNGFRLEGAGSNTGWSVSSAGDVNGDGFDDVIIGSRFAALDGAGPSAPQGASYVVFGQPSGWSSSLDLSSLDGTNGFRLDGVDLSDWSGYSVSSAGDVNGDGFDDVIIGSPYADPSDQSRGGESHVVFGQSSGWSPSLDLSSLDGTYGFRIDGEGRSDLSGHSVSSAGDVNGDGFDDVIIGAYGADPDGQSLSGASYVVFGQSSGWNSSLDLSSLNGSNGFRIDGEGVNDQIGISVSSAGDFNGDGFDDVIIGAPYSSLPSDLSGASYVVFGQSSGWSSSLDLSSLNGTNGFRIDGGEPSLHYSGYSVSSAGDVNGDGNGDVIIGAYGASRITATGTYVADIPGVTYVVFGQSSGWGSSFDLSSVDGAGLDGSNGFGFRLVGVDSEDYSGWSVSSAGDVNGDGTGDVIIGSPYANRNSSFEGAGASYVVFGRPPHFAWKSSLALSSLSGTNGFRLDGVGWDDRSGSSVSSAGDVNGDGFDDVIIGAWHADDEVGESYVVFGGQNGWEPIQYSAGDGGLWNSLALDGFQGYGYIDGGEGFDTVVYSVASAEVSFTEGDTRHLVIQNIANPSESDTLLSIERLQFSDKSYALDIGVDGNAGVAAKAIIASFGVNGLNVYMRTALSLVDSGQATLEDLCDLVVANNLIENEIGSSTNGSFVDHVYENLVGFAPSDADHDTYTALLDTGFYSKSSLLALAANSPLTTDIMTANLVDLIGLPVSADGELLALQYDLG